MPDLSNDEVVEWSTIEGKDLSPTPSSVKLNADENAISGSSPPSSTEPSSPPDSASLSLSTTTSPPPPYPPYPRSRQYFHSKPADFQKKTKPNRRDMSLLNAVKANYRFIYRINDGIGTTNTMLQKVCEERGWKEFRECSLFRPGASPYERAMRGATGWNLWWSYSIYQFNPYKYLRNWQFTNHNPKGFQFCNKLYLTMYMRKMEVIHGSTFDFYPASYIIPEDYLRLTADHFRRAGDSFTQYNYNNLLGEKPTTCYSEPVPATPKPPNSASSSSSYTSSPYNSNFRRPKIYTTKLRPFTASRISQIQASFLHENTHFRFNPVWISKPVALSQGKGIFLTTDLNTITTDKKAIVQEYITRPLLIGGYKWDVRIYVCVAAVDPLVIYIYNEGLCRFCTEKYDTKDLSRMYSHLTNASLNKFSPAYEDDKDLIGQGCKWSLKKLRQYFKDKRIHDWLLWQKVMAMIVLTVIGDSLRLGYSASNRNCFDLFGFDVLVDENLKPWLLECNYSPGLGGDCETDEVVKIPMLHELFDLLGFPDKDSYSETEEPPPTTTTSTQKGDEGGGDAFGNKSDSSSGQDAIIPYDKDDITRHYFDMLLARIKVSSTSEGDALHQRKKFTEDVNAKAEMRLNDAKTIYSQNLVVQYLKNQSTGGGKLSRQVRDQLISVASKKLRNKLTALTGGNSSVTKKDKKAARSGVPEPSLKVQQDEQEVDETLDGLSKTENNNFTNASSSSFSSGKNNGKIKDKEEPLSPVTPTKAKSTPSSQLILNTIKKEFPTPDSEAFQKLKYYFDAGIDYPMDIKTGKFKDCPALISVKKDWFSPPKQVGGWVRVYPFDARTVKSPYKSSLTDIKQAVRSIESYLKVAEHLYFDHPNESDEFFQRKVRSITRRDTEIWVPPSPSTTLSGTPVAASVKARNKKRSEETDVSSTCNSSGDTGSEKGANNIPIVESDIIDNQNNNILCANSYCWQSSDEMSQ